MGTTIHKPTLEKIKLVLLRLLFSRVQWNDKNGMSKEEMMEHFSFPRILTDEELAEILDSLIDNSGLFLGTRYPDGKVVYTLVDERIILRLPQGQDQSQM